MCYVLTSHGSCKGSNIGIGNGRGGNNFGIGGDLKIAYDCSGGINVGVGDKLTSTCDSDSSGCNNTGVGGDLMSACDSSVRYDNLIRENTSSGGNNVGT